jgi:hypothetical protein
MANPAPYYNPTGMTTQPGVAPSWSGNPGYQAPSSPSPMATTWGQPGTGSYQPGGYGSTPDTYFDDPLTQPIMGAWGARMSQLSRPAPQYGDINAQLGKYLQPDPRMNAAMGSLASVAQGPGASNAYTGQFAAATKKRIAQLNADPFSTGDEAAIKARFFDSMAGDRDAAYQQNAAEMARRGLAPSSGVAQALGAETSMGYQKARAAQTQQMLQYVTDEANRRKDLGVSMSGNLAQQGGQDAALAQQWQATRAGILGNVLQALQAQQGMGLNAATTMASLRRQQYLDDDARGNSLLETSALPSAIAQQRMQALNQVLAGGPTASSIFNQYSQMQQNTNQQNQINAQKNAAIWGAVGQIGGGIAQGVFSGGNG